MESLFGKGDKFNKTRGGEGKTNSPPKPTDEGDFREMFVQLCADMKLMKEKMASVERLESDVIALRQLTEESKQAVNEAVKTVKS